MIKLNTKTIASLAVVTAAAAAVPGLSRLTLLGSSQFDKLLQRHDRKAEIRALILNMSAYDLRKQLRTVSFETIVQRSGMTTRAFRMALFGMLRNELRARGWTGARIDGYISARLARVAAGRSANNGLLMLAQQ